MRLIISLFSILILVTVISSRGQVIGKTFDAEYTIKNFGEVVNTLKIDNVEFKSMLKSGGEYIMFNI